MWASLNYICVCWPSQIIIKYAPSPVLTENGFCRLLNHTRTAEWTRQSCLYNIPLNVASIFLKIVTLGDLIYVFKIVTLADLIYVYKIVTLVDLTYIFQIVTLVDLIYVFWGKDCDLGGFDLRF